MTCLSFSCQIKAVVAGDELCVCVCVCVCVYERERERERVMSQNEVNGIRLWENYHQ